MMVNKREEVGKKLHPRTVMSQAMQKKEHELPQQDMSLEQTIEGDVVDLIRKLRQWIEECLKAKAAGIVKERMIGECTGIPLDVVAAGKQLLEYYGSKEVIKTEVRNG